MTDVGSVGVAYDKNEGEDDGSDDDKMTDGIPVTNDGNVVKLSSTVGVRSEGATPGILVWYDKDELISNDERMVVGGREVKGGVGCAVVKTEGDIGIDIEDGGIGVVVRDGIGGLTDSVSE